MTRLIAARALGTPAIVAALVWLLLALPAGAGPDEPYVLIGPDAGAFVTALKAEGADTDPTLSADVVVLVLEPYGLVRMVLIDTAARSKFWATVRPEAVAAILARLGEGA
jgi:hypothetical protein